MRVDVPSLQSELLPVRATRTYERLIVGALLVLWCAHMLAFLAIVPPWQHYDEPTHFEYAMLIRETGGLPPGDTFIPALRRAIACSMQATGFYRNPVASISPPDLDSPTLSIGINERGHPPLYYALVALATLPLRHASVETQLYAGRSVSVALGVLLFIFAYALLRLLTGADWERRCWVLAALALQPAFADNMSSLNSDALANLVGVLMLLTSVWAVQQTSKAEKQKVNLILRAPLAQRSRFLPLLFYLLPLLVLVLAFNVKRTLLVVGLIVPMAWLLTLSRRRQLVAAFAGAAGAVAALVWLLAQPWTFADWNGTFATPPPVPAYAGRAAFALSYERPDTLTQTLYAPQARTIVGKHVSLAAWMRADREHVAASSPVLVLDSHAISHTVMLGTHWQRVTLEADVPPGNGVVSVHLSAPTTLGTVLYDELALVGGLPDNLPAPGEPDGSLEIGLLSVPPRNLLRNADAERQVPMLAVLPMLKPLASRATLPDILSHTFNPRWIAAAYPPQALALFESAWGVFGWGEISVSSGWFAPLGLLVLLSIVGALRYTCQLARAGNNAERAVWWLCLLAVALGWGMALLRIHDQPFPGLMFWSFGRYTFVTMVPSMIVFINGLWTIFPASVRRQGMMGVILFVSVFALVALFGTVLPVAP